MKQPVDSFFNKKLKHYAGEAPAAAWDRIDANLSREKKPLIWLKIAAGISVPLVAGLILYFSAGQSNQQLAVVEKTSPPQEIRKTEATAPATPAAEERSAVVVQPAELPSARTVNAAAEKKTDPLEKTQPLEKAAEELIASAAVVADNAQEITPTVAEMTTETEPVIAEPEFSGTPEENITIVITAEEANAKYLNQQYIADATPENKKSSKLRSLFEKAQDMDPIGEFRQFKNEVLALNFRNDKKGERNR